MSRQALNNVFLGFLLFVCVFYLTDALKMEIGTVTNPDSGFLPVLIGGFSVGLSVVLLIKNITAKKGKDQSESKDVASKGGILRLLGFILILIIFMMSFITVGIFMLFPLIVVLSKIFGFQGWRYPILLGAVFTLIIYGVFDKLLEVPLPTGIF